MSNSKMCAVYSYKMLRWNFTDLHIIIFKIHFTTSYLHFYFMPDIFIFQFSFLKKPKGRIFVKKNIIALQLVLIKRGKRQ